MQTVLIAEDDLVYSKLLVSKLKEYGSRFEVISAKDGKEAIEILRQKTISLLVTDIQMPKIDGFKLLAHMNDVYPAIPCFVMTAYRPQETKEKVREEIIRFFHKPLNAEKLGQAIVEVLERDIPLGALRGISVVRFLEMIEMGQKTCLFEVTLPGKEVGLFYFDTGVLYDVVCGDLHGEEAAMAFMTMERAKFKFKYFPRKKIAKRMKADLSTLIREAKRREIGLKPKNFADIRLP